MKENPLGDMIITGFTILFVKLVDAFFYTGHSIMKETIKSLEKRLK
jgi:hypothetical protein